MSLTPCRACGHAVDTSALACPGCGATDPAKKISRQERDLYFSIAHTIVWICVLGAVGWGLWTVGIPRLRQIFDRPVALQPALPDSMQPIAPALSEDIQDDE
ncbi:MAG: hypothetical protein LBJ76_01950 [Candidatus Accumulibacter sp.]|jgi:hypothetical protein|nr:hypothetical protein [Accumulibacter sp.]